jgi:hypothetical protein
MFNSHHYALVINSLSPGAVDGATSLSSMLMETWTSAAGFRSSERICLSIVAGHPWQLAGVRYRAVEPSEKGL